MSEIIHAATVTATEKNSITLLLSSGACDGCALHSVCGPAAQQGRTINIKTPDAETFAVGQTVDVVLSQTQALNAAFWGYIAPLILMLTVLFAALAFSSETLAAALALAVLPFYYCILWLCRDKLKKTLQIKIR